MLERRALEYRFYTKINPLQLQALECVDFSQGLGGTFQSEIKTDPLLPQMRGAPWKSGPLGPRKVMQWMWASALVEAELSPRSSLASCRPEAFGDSGFCLAFAWLLPLGGAAVHRCDKRLS
jgi:hypothetical protein